MAETSRGKRFVEWVGPLLAALAVAGCATVPEGDSARGEESARILEPAPVLDAEDDLLYQVLVGEMAAATGDSEQAGAAWQRAVALSDDPAVAERATWHALQAGQEERALAAGRRWEELVDEPDARLHQILGFLYLRDGQAGPARHHLRELMLASEQPPEQLFQRLESALGSRESRAAALEVVSDLVAEHPEQPSGHRLLARLALDADEPERARDAAVAGLNQAPGDARLERLRVQALFEMGETDAALEAMAALVETQEDNWRLHLDYARRLQQAGRDDAARSVFGRLRDTWPEEPQVLYSAAMLSLEVGYREQAQTYLEDLLELGSRRGAAHYFLGRIAEDQGRVRDALNRYERVESGDYRSRAGLRRAVVLGREGRVARAREAFEAHRARFPEQAPRAFLMEAQMLRELGRREDAATVYEQGLAEHPDNADLRYGRGLLRAVSGDIDGAEADFRHILEADPDHVDALNALGYTLVDSTDRLEEGLELIRRAHEQDPENPAILDSLGWANYKLDRPERALDYLRRAYRGHQSGEIAAHLGEVLWQQGQRDEARAIWQEALERDGDDPVLQETLERLAPEVLSR